MCVDFRDGEEATWKIPESPKSCLESEVAQTKRVKREKRGFYITTFPTVPSFKTVSAWICLFRDELPYESELDGPPL